MRWLLALPVLLIGAAAPPIHECVADACVSVHAWEGNGQAQLALNVSHPHAHAHAHAHAADGGSHAYNASIPCNGPCPDLIIDPLRTVTGLHFQDATFASSDCSVLEGSVQPGARRLMRFTLTTPNGGEGDLVVGDPLAQPQWFDWGTCHGHWHLDGFADYRLWTPQAYEDWQEARQAYQNWTSREIIDAEPGLQAGLVSSHKQGFCVMDVRQYDYTQPKAYPNCGNQGITRGWADEYIFSLDGQWIDVTGLSPGRYVLELEVNPNRVFEELDYGNNAFALAVVVR